ncbi:Kanamycin B dioxygenase [Colletotrichum sidae]|uniref:Kanamycin B dioxygenase n=1 Tax=Colletotrichum sidae TaxID=1347389 RepID=A0A4R8TNM7_9PEZI|nr:Kanamycin B dioxygenase [Colletotrichum sidae]
MGPLPSPSCSEKSLTFVPEARQPAAVSIPKRDLLHGTTSLETVQECLEAFHRDGVVVIEDAVSHKSLDHLYTQMRKDADVLLSTDRPHFNHDKSARNLSQPLPVAPEFLHEDIWANPHAVAVLEHILGPRPQLAFAGANTALPNGTGRQAVHSDAYFRHLDFTFGVEVNIFLSGASQDNGVTEVWPGTHVGFNYDDQVPGTRGWIKKPALEARVLAHGPPVQPTVRKGGLVLRDLRTWHAGMPNRTADPRIMVGFVYFPSWYRTPMRLTFPGEARRTLRSWRHVDATTTAEFVDSGVDHLTLPFSMNLTQEEDGALGRSSKKKRRLFEKPAVTEDNFWAPAVEVS